MAFTSTSPLVSFVFFCFFFFSPGVLTCRDAESVASTIRQMWIFLVDYLAGTLHFRLKLEPIRHLTCSRTHSSLTIIIFTPAKRHFRCSHSFSFGLKIRICKYLHKRILRFFDSLRLRLFYHLSSIGVKWFLKMDFI